MTDERAMGEGRTADVLALDDRRAVKLFSPDASRESVEREAANARAAYDAGAPTPAVHEVVERDGRFGVVFERVDGTLLADRLRARPWRVRSLARSFADCHAAVHDATVSDLPPLRDRLRRRIEAASIAPELRNSALSRLDSLPDGVSPSDQRERTDGSSERSSDGARLCHGDFHPENVMVADGDLTVIDWRDATAGHPVADLARTDLVLRLAAAADGPLRRLLVAGFRRAYRRRYRRTTGVDADAVEAWTLPVAVARLTEGVPGEADRLRALVAERSRSEDPDIFNR